MKLKHLCLFIATDTCPPYRQFFRLSPFAWPILQAAYVVFGALRRCKQEDSQGDYQVLSRLNDGCAHSYEAFDLFFLLLQGHAHTYMDGIFYVAGHKQADNPTCQLIRRPSSLDDLGLEHQMPEAWHNHVSIFDIEGLDRWFLKMLQSTSSFLLFLIAFQFLVISQSGPKLFSFSYHPLFVELFNART